MNSRKIFFLLFLLFASGVVYAQRPAGPTRSQDTGRLIRLISADTYRRVKQDSLTELNMLIGHVVLQQGNTIFFLKIVCPPGRGFYEDDRLKNHFHEPDPATSRVFLLLTMPVHATGMVATRKSGQVAPMVERRIETPRLQVRTLD